VGSELAKAGAGCVWKDEVETSAEDDGDEPTAAAALVWQAWAMTVYKPSASGTGLNGTQGSDLSEPIDIPDHPLFCIACLDAVFL
jgi:hypothetical protein